LSVNFQYLQNTHFNTPGSGADQMFTNIESYFNHVLRQNFEL